MLNLTQSNTDKFGVRKQGIHASVNLGKITLGITTLALVFLLGLFYIVQVNDTSTMGYEIHDLEKRLEELSDSQKEKEVQQAKLQSIQRLESESIKLNFNNVDKLEYTTPLEESSPSYALR